MHEHQDATNAHCVPKIIPQPPIRLHRISRKFSNTTNINTAFEQQKSTNFHLGWEHQKAILFPRSPCCNETLKYEIEINYTSLPNLTLQLPSRLHRNNEKVKNIKFYKMVSMKVKTLSFTLGGNIRRNQVSVMSLFQGDTKT